jgi:hypothetical protein
MGHFPMQKAILPRPATTQFQHLTCWNSMTFTSESSARKKNRPVDHPMELAKKDGYYGWFWLSYRWLSIFVLL